MPCEFHAGVRELKAEIIITYVLALQKLLQVRNCVEVWVFNIFIT